MPGTTFVSANVLSTSTPNWRAAISALITAALTKPSRCRQPNEGCYYPEFRRCLLKDGRFPNRPFAIGGLEAAATLFRDVAKQNSRALASPAVVDCCGRDTAMRCPRTAQRAVPTLLIIHSAHARTHAAARRHPAALFLLRKFGDDGFGGEQEAGDRSGVLQRSA